MTEKAPRVYPERSDPESESLQQAVEILERPPTVELNPAQLKQVKEFEQALFYNRDPFAVASAANNNETNPTDDPEQIFNIPEKNLAEIDAIEAKRTVLCIEYLQTEAGQALLEEVTGKEVESPDAAAVKKFLATNLEGYTLKQTKELKAASDKFVRDLLKYGLIKEKGLIPNDSSDNDAVQVLIDTFEKSTDPFVNHLISQFPKDIHLEPTFFAFLRDPEKLLEKASHLKQMRSYLHTIAQTLREQPESSTKEAQKVILSIYREKLNILYSDVYRQATSLIVQNEASGTDHYGELLAGLQQNLPALRRQESPSQRLESARDKEQISRFLSRLDKFINGADAKQSTPLMTSRDDLKTQFSVPLNREILENHEYADVPVDLLRETFVTADIMKRLAEIALAEYGFLSTTRQQEDDDGEKSSESAATEYDGWKVVVTSRVTSCAINGPKKTFSIPETFNMPLLSPSGSSALKILDHEITHAWQHENASHIDLELFKKSRAGRGSLWFETGAMVQEIESSRRLFGKQYEGPMLAYLAAMEKRLEGGSITECVSAFFDSYKQRYPAASTEEMLKLAADRTLRIFRHGEGVIEHGAYVSNSAALEYAEQHLLSAVLPEAVKPYLYVGRINLGVLARLHQVGLFEGMQFNTPNRRASQVVEPYVRSELLHLGQT